MKFATLLLGTLISFDLMAKAVVGQAAPDFAVSDTAGKQVKLSDFRGKWLVLEWYNKDCPYVRKHYDSQNMQNLQKSYSAKGVSWVTVTSSAEGKQGYLTASDAAANSKKEGMSVQHLLLDSSGVMGKAYDAKTTPHMFVVDPNGIIVYAGAIDDNDSASPKVISKSVNYVSAALDAAMANKPVPNPSTKPYGCSVKY